MQVEAATERAKRRAYRAVTKQAWSENDPPAPKYAPEFRVHPFAVLCSTTVLDVPEVGRCAARHPLLGLLQRLLWCPHEDLIQLHFPESMMSGASLPARVPFATLQSGLPFNAAAANSRIDIATPFETLGRAYGFAAGVCVRCMWDAHCGHAQRACFVLCVYDHCIFFLYHFHTFLYTPLTLNPKP